MTYTTVQQLELDLAALDRLIASQAITPQQAEMIRTSLLAQYTNVGGQQQISEMALKAAYTQESK
jgi:hypothetical protein